MMEINRIYRGIFDEHNYKHLSKKKGIDLGKPISSYIVPLYPILKKIHQ